MPGPTDAPPGASPAAPAQAAADHELALQALHRRLSARVARERLAREEAERLLERKSLELYEANQALSAAAAELERRVEERTRELYDERQRALQRADVDALTGIANRSAFARGLQEALADPAVRAGGVVALLIDLDDFKRVNDSLGHAAGDALLVAVASRLSLAVRPGDLVARLGGDEFAVIARAVPDLPAAHTLAQRLLELVCRPVLLQGRSVPCGCSIGVAQAGSERSDDLLRDADLALYAAKRAGRGRVMLFRLELRAEMERRAALDRDVRQAVALGQIHPWYQPVWRPAQRRFVGAEVLARWHLPNGEVRSPADFLGAVEDLGLLDAMMEGMLRRALPDAAQWVSQGRLDYLSINVSPTQFNEGWAQARLPQLLSDCGFPPSALVIELTETALLQDIVRTRQMLQVLVALGMRIAIDDFGVGYSNFSLLRQLPFALLKLDRTLITDIETDPHARAVAECILALASRLGIQVVSEGVESAGQARLLTEAGSDALQGFWLARPGPGLAAWFTPAADPPTA